MKFFTMCITAFLVGAIIGSIFPLPLNIIFGGIAGGLIGWNWDKIWSLFKHDDDGF